MSQEYIEIRGARENNLKDVSLRIPKRNITIFTGVSGSGNPSIVFDTIATALSVDQARQFLTLYQALQAFDERAGQTRINCPGLCLVGSADEMQYGAQWGNVHVSIVGPIVAGRAELEGLGWDEQSWKVSAGMCNCWKVSITCRPCRRRRLCRCCVGGWVASWRRDEPPHPPSRRRGGVG